uniref:Uncharacterized protein n=1 Tax=Arundo donax TaxID=35708 RepID=A0A0A9AH34_ARUDO
MCRPAWPPSSAFSCMAIQTPELDHWLHPHSNSGSVNPMVHHSAT